MPCLNLGLGVGALSCLGACTSCSSQQLVLLIFLGWERPALALQRLSEFWPSVYSLSAERQVQANNGMSKTRRDKTRRDKTRQVSQPAPADELSSPPHGLLSAVQVLIPRSRPNNGVLSII